MTDWIDAALARERPPRTSGGWPTHKHRDRMRRARAHVRARHRRRHRRRTT